MAQALFNQWEDSLLGRTQLDSIGFRSLFIKCVGQMLDHDTGTNLDHEDVRHVLHEATGIGIGWADASGPSRAAEVLAYARANEHTVRSSSSATGRLLLSVVSRPDAELSMDELTFILEGLQQHVGPEWEIVFGHDIAPSLTAELRLLYVKGVGAGL